MPLIVPFTTHLQNQAWAQVAKYVFQIVVSSCVMGATKSFISPHATPLSTYCCTQQTR